MALSEVVSFQLGISVALMVLTVIFGMIPSRLNVLPQGSQEKILHHFGYFTGGVFLGAGMLHMLPSSLNVSTRWNYPWAFFMSALGFLVVWGIDHVHVVAMDDDECESHCKNYHKHSDSMEYGTSHEDHLKKPISHERSHSMGHSHDLGHLQKTNTESTPFFDRRASHTHKAEATPKCAIFDKCSHKHPAQVVGTSLIIAALFSIHSFIAGLALGAQQELDPRFYAILTAIMGHKAIEALTVGAQFVKEKIPFSSSLPIILLYCFMTPAGICFGIVVQRFISHTSTEAFEALVQSFAAGSFIYLSVHEMSSEAGYSPIFVQLALVFLGFGLMSLLAVWT